jgi:hypothetical protein
VRRQTAVRPGIKRPSDIHFRMIANVPGIRRVDAKSFYCASKDAEVGLSKSLSLRDKNIVN